MIGSQDSNLKPQASYREVPANNTKGKTFEAIGLIQATVDEVYKVLTKFEDYHTFKPHVTDVEILERDDHHALLNYTLTLPLGKRKRYRLSKTYENTGSLAVWMDCRYSVQKQCSGSSH